MIRCLTKFDFASCISIVALKDKLGGTTPLDIAQFTSTYENHFSTSESNRIALGYFDNDDLISFVLISFHESKMRGKFWIISGFYTKQFKTFFTFATPDSGQLIKAAFDFAEAREYYEYYYCTAEKVQAVYERQWNKNPYQPLGRYEKITLYTVPPNTKPEFELSWRMMGEQTKPDTIIFKKRILKEQYRKKTV
jgi:hypothetical protein